jgi:hypothetical protein
VSGTEENSAAATRTPNDPRARKNQNGKHSAGAPALMKTGEQKKDFERQWKIRRLGESPAPAKMNPIQKNTSLAANHSRTNKALQINVHHRTGPYRVETSYHFLKFYFASLVYEWVKNNLVSIKWVREDGDLRESVVIGLGSIEVSVFVSYHVPVVSFFWFAGFSWGLELLVLSLSSFFFLGVTLFHSVLMRFWVLLPLVCSIQSQGLAQFLLCVSGWATVCDLGTWVNLLFYRWIIFK